MLKKLFHYSIIVTALIVVAIISYLYYHHEKIYPTTDDAYVQANVVYVAPQVSGKISHVYVHDQQHVKTGQKLFQIDQRPFLIAIREAKANLDNTVHEIKADQAAVKVANALVIQREAELINQNKATNRILILVKHKFLSSQAGDAARAKLDVAKAALIASKNQLKETVQRLGNPGKTNSQIQAAKAKLAQAELNLHYTTVISPTDGTLVKFTLCKGTGVTAYEQLFALVENKLFWIDANFREADLARLQPGQSVRIKIDMYPGTIFKGIIHTISAGSGAAFSLLPPENATGNWVKVTQRFPVQIYFAKQYPQFVLRMGASAEITVDTGKRVEGRG